MTRALSSTAAAEDFLRGVASTSPQPSSSSSSWRPEEAREAQTMLPQPQYDGDWEIQAEEEEQQERVGGRRREKRHAEEEEEENEEVWEAEGHLRRLRPHASLNLFAAASSINDYGIHKESHPHTGMTAAAAATAAAAEEGIVRRRLGQPNLRCPALVLNQDLTPLTLFPLTIAPWWSAIRSTLRGRVSVLESYDRRVRSTHALHQLPSVVALTRLQTPSYSHKHYDDAPAASAATPDAQSSSSSSSSSTRRSTSTSTSTSTSRNTSNRSINGSTSSSCGWSGVEGAAGVGEDTLSAWRMPGVEGAAGVGGEALHAWRIPRPFRRNVALRDGYRCCFCGCRLSYRTLTLDHVVPKCLGGEDSWENLASACMRCNSRKGSLRVEELGKINMRLLQAPYAPTALQLAYAYVDLLPAAILTQWGRYLEGPLAREAAKFRAFHAAFSLPPSSPPSSAAAAAGKPMTSFLRVEEASLPQVMVTATAAVASARAKGDEEEGAAPLSEPLALST